MSRVILINAPAEQTLLGDILEVIGVEYQTMEPEALLVVREMSSLEPAGVLIISESGLLALKPLVDTDCRKIRDVFLGFREILVFPLDGGEQAAAMLGAIIDGTVVFRRFHDDQHRYSVANNRARCGPFAGLSFGPIKPKTDRGISVLSRNVVQTVVSIDDSALMAHISIGPTQIFLIGCASVFDGGTECKQNLNTADCFSELVPLLFFLLNNAEVNPWRPNRAFASVVLDDPNLRRRYGCVSFPLLSQLTHELQCAVSVGFIPWNAYRNSSSIVDLFRSAFPRLSLCVHGCDHTAREFSTRSVREAFGLILLGQQRLRKFAKSTGLQCDRVIVFPQAFFSPSAMEALRHSELIGAVNTEIRVKETDRGVPAREVLSLAVCAYSGFPLFLRRRPGEPLENFALDLLLGKPCLIVTHHDFYHDRCAALSRLVESINRLHPGLCWTNLEQIVSESYLVRRGVSDGFEARVFASETKLSVDADSPPPSIIRKAESLAGPFEVAADGNSIPYSVSGKDLIISRVALGRGDRLSIRRPIPLGVAPVEHSVKYRVRVAARRYLSEIRDNYVVPAKLAIRSLAGSRR